ncbi:hypothetical protein Droror1_Dr00007216 [Drosera rotundifolia]
MFNVFAYILKAGEIQREEDYLYLMELANLKSKVAAAAANFRLSHLTKISWHRIWQKMVLLLDLDHVALLVVYESAGFARMRSDEKPERGLLQDMPVQEMCGGQGGIFGFKSCRLAAFHNTTEN